MEARFWTPTLDHSLHCGEPNPKGGQGAQFEKNKPFRDVAQNIMPCFVAQHEQSLRVFMSHPWLGVGFSNFNDYVTGDPYYVASYQGVSSVDWPHSNLAAVLAETGILGFAPYMIMHVLLVCAVWQLRHLSGHGRLVVRYCVYMFVAYWITGLTESTGFNPFVNLWYVFLITTCYKYAVTAPFAILPAEAQVPEGALSAPARIFSPLFLR